MTSRDLYIEGQNVTRVVKALSSEVRLRILDLLDEGEMNIQMLEERLQLSKTAVVSHLRSLEEAGFITTRYVPGSVGNQKMCTKVYDRLIFNFTPQRENGERKQYYEVEVSPGNYFDFQVYPPCGLADEGHVIHKWDDPAAFFDLERVKAQIVWCAYGYVEYRFPLNIPFQDLGLRSVNIMLEIGAQGGLHALNAQGEKEYHPALIMPNNMTKERITESKTDITFWVGGVETFTLPVEEYSRYERGGRYTPKWWRGSAYGTLVSLWVGPDGTFLEGQKVGDVTLDQILDNNRLVKDRLLKTSLTSSDYLSFRVGIKPEAKHISGFNIFGKGFGNYPINIVARFY